jgi:lysophospholipase L1-like esterase
MRTVGAVGERRVRPATPLTSARTGVATLIALVVAVGFVVIENVGIAAWFPRLSRLPADVSPSYLHRELNFMAEAPPSVVFLGDSVVWGYRLPADETAVALLAARGCACRNLAMRAGSPPNDYALVRLLANAGIRPKQVVHEVNQKAFNPADADYRRLLPGIAALAEPLLSPADRALLPGSDANVPTPFDRALSSAWLLYAFRADLRDTYLNGEKDAPFQRPTPELYEGTYDLTPLGPKNVGVHFLDQTADALHAAGIPLVAFLTPVNRALLADYVDNREYRANKRYLQVELERRGARVVDLEASLPPDSFIDNAHLTAAGQRQLANRLAPLLAR